MEKQALKQFELSWTFIRAMTIDFIKSVPDEYWMTSPHPDYSSFAKQARHMVWISGLYNDALKNKKINLENKKNCFNGELDRIKIINNLNKQDLILKNFLQNISHQEADSYEMDFFGTKIGLYEFLNNMIQHESIHHGIWTFYAKSSGYQTPKTWQSNWKL